MNVRFFYFYGWTLGECDVGAFFRFRYVVLVQLRLENQRKLLLHFFKCVVHAVVICFVVLRLLVLKHLFVSLVDGR